MGRGEFVAVMGTDIAGDGSNRSVSYHWVQWQNIAEVRCCYDEQDAKSAQTARHHKRAFYGNLNTRDRGLVKTRKAAIHLLGYDSVGVGYGFGDLLTTGTEAIPQERVIPFAAGVAPLGGEKAEAKFDNIAIQFAIGMRERLHLSSQGVTLGHDINFGVRLNLEIEAKKQLGERRFEVNEQTNRLRLQPKAKLKESPDHFDALLIAYFTLCMALRRSAFPWAMHFCRFPRQ